MLLLRTWKPFASVRSTLSRTGINVRQSLVDIITGVGGGTLSTSVDAGGRSGGKPRLKGQFE